MRYFWPLYLFNWLTFTVKLTRAVRKFFAPYQYNYKQWRVNNKDRNRQLSDDETTLSQREHKLVAKSDVDIVRFLL